MILKRKEACGYLSIKLFIINLILIVLVSCTVIIAAVIRHLRQSRPATNGTGYHNKSLFKIEHLARACTVVTPVSQCKDNSTSCVAQVKYTADNTASDVVTTTTHNRFSMTSRYARYQPGESVTCYYDEHRLDLVSYLRETNANMHFAGLVIALVLTNLTFLLVEAVLILSYILWRRRKWNRLYSDVE